MRNPEASLGFKKSSILYVTPCVYKSFWLPIKKALENMLNLKNMSLFIQRNNVGLMSK